MDPVFEDPFEEGDHAEVVSAIDEDDLRVELNKQAPDRAGELAVAPSAGASTRARSVEAALLQGVAVSL